MKVELYSALYGSYDWLKPLRDIGIMSTMYTDSDIMAKQAVGAGWSQAIVIDHGIATLKGSPTVTAPMLAHKFWKTHPHLACPTANISLWIDASMEIVVDDYVDRCLAALGEDDWSCVPHPARNCIYPEAQFSATLARYDADAILAQAAHYGTFHPAGFGLIATGANVRRHTPEVIEVCKQWWVECLNWSHQDQLSLPVLLRLAEGKVRWNMNLPWFQWWQLWPHS
jgi:hypothetical protein